MNKGVDYSTQPASWGAFFDRLKAKGYSFIYRYLYDYDDPKRLTREELDAAFAAGIKLGCYFETSEGACLDGYKRGVAHAERAQAELVKLALPADLPVCFCIDIDATKAQLEGAISRYFEGVLSRMPLERIGVYGGYRQVEYICWRGLASWAVQTEAWSRFDEKGRLNGVYPVTWSQYAQVRQWTDNGPGVIGGVQCDGLDLVGEVRLYHPDKGDEVDPEIIKLIKQGRVSDVARSYDIKILRAEIKGDAERAAILEAEKAADVAAVKAALGLTDE